MQTDNSSLMIGRCAGVSLCGLVLSSRCEQRRVCVVPDCYIMKGLKIESGSTLLI